MSAGQHGHASQPDPASSRAEEAARRRHAWQAVVAVVAVGLVGGVAGVFIGRATDAGEPKPSLSASWQALPPAPIPGRIAASSVWTGKEMIVWGGYTGKVTPGPCGGCASDGAVYDPATRTWRAISPSPAGVRGGGANSAAWTGDEMVVWASNSPDGPAGAAAYDPETDTWRRLPPGPLGGREGYATVWTGKELLVIGGHRGDAAGTPAAAALDPRTGTWRVLPAFERFGFFGGPSGAVWDGHEAIVMGNVSLCPERGSACAEHRPTLVAYDPATDRAREIPLPAPSADFGSDTAASLTPIAWTGSEVVFTAAAPGSVQIIRYNPTIGGWKGVPAGQCHIVATPAQGHGCRDWRNGPAAPCVIAAGQSAWLGDRYVAPCGEDGLQVYALATGSWDWRTLAPGPSPLNSRGGSAMVWTGSELIVWSGSTYERGNPTPANGASLNLKG